MQEKMLTLSSEPARLDPDLPVNSDLSSGYRAAGCISGSLVTVVLTHRFSVGPFFFFFPEILVRTLPLLFPPRF